MPESILGHLTMCVALLGAQILYNKANNEYVLLFHADTPKFGYPAVGVAVAKEIRGPYTWLRVFKPDGLDSYDMGVFQEDDGTAFLVRSVKNEYVGISQLSPDYTDTLGITSTVPRVRQPPLLTLNKDVSRSIWDAAQVSSWKKPNVMYMGCKFILVKVNNKVHHWWSIFNVPEDLDHGLVSICRHKRRPSCRCRCHWF